MSRAVSQDIVAPEDSAAGSEATSSGWRKTRVAALVVMTVIAGAIIGAAKLLPKPPDPVDVAISASWGGSSTAPRQWAEQDLTQRECTAYGNRPPDREAVAIMQREWRRIIYPADGDLAGNWERGAPLARATAGASPGNGTLQGNGVSSGGQCLACHHLEPSDLARAPSAKAGPSLVGYGRIRGFEMAARQPLYEQIYNSNAVVACSIMPRFGAHKVLTPEQIRDIVAYLLAPQSPVNRP